MSGVAFFCRHSYCIVIPAICQGNLPAGAIRRLGIVYLPQIYCNRLTIFYIAYIVSACIVEMQCQFLRSKAMNSANTFSIYYYVSIFLYSEDIVFNTIFGLCISLPSSQLILELRTTSLRSKIIS